VPAAVIYIPYLTPLLALILLNYEWALTNKRSPSKSTLDLPISYASPLSSLLRCSHPPYAQWVVSTDCSSSLCSQANGHSYDPSSSSKSTSFDFSIQYLQGSVSGPIVWDSVEIGGYEIGNQALGSSHLTKLSGTHIPTSPC